MSTSLAPARGLDAAAALIRRLTGLIFPASRRGALEQALRRAMARAGLQDLGAYLARLEADRDLLDDVAGDLTVGESYFFRSPEQFDLIAEAVLRGTRASRGDRPLRLWSAGCAAGEEAYTLAILLHQRGLAGQAHILATDLSRASLEKARRARYSRWALRGVPEGIVAAYFRRTGDEFDLAPAIRDLVEFRYLNLAADTYPSLAAGVWGLDLVVCRNVLIYFDAETVKRVVGRFLDCLGDDGWLLLGPSDPPIAERVRCEVVVTRAGLLYRRADTLVAPEVAQPSVEWRLAEPAVVDLAPSTTPGPPQQRTDPSLDGEPPKVSSADVVRELANAGRLEEAGRACAAALDRERYSAELAYLHAILLAEARRTPEAVTAARRALYLDRGLTVAHLALGAALARTRDTRGARRAFRNAANLLAAMPPDAVVPCSDGERAGRLVEMARAHLHLLAPAAA